MTRPAPRHAPHYPDMVLRCVGCVGFVATWVCLAVAIALVINFA